MGLCASTPRSPEDKEEKQHSQAIDVALHEEQRRANTEFKILLLGPGESGKSTIVKQMKIIHQNGYSQSELMQYRLTVIKNLVDSAQAVVLAMRKLMLEPHLVENRVCCG